MRTVRRYAGRAVKGLGLAALFLTALPPFRPTALAAQETNLTIYADGRVIVRRSLPVAVARGTTTIAADLGMRELDPASLVALDSGIEVKGVRVSGAVGADGSLRRSVGTDVFFRTGSDSLPRYVRAHVLSVDPPAVRLDGGNVMYAWPGTPVFPDSMVQLAPRYELTLEASRPATSLRLLYLSSGLSWAAAYTVLVPRGGSGTASITGVARIENGASVSLSGVRVQLLAGDVRQAPQPRPVMAMARMSAGAASDEVSQESVGETHAYALPGTVDFVPGETRTIALFPAATAPVEPQLVLRQGGYGFMAQWPDAMRDQHPEITYRVRRPAASAFGQLPVPGGTFRLFEPDSEGRPQLIGEVSVPHTPAARDLFLTTGTSFDVTAQRAQTTYERTGDREAISAYRVTLQNAKSQAVAVLVTDQCPGRCEVLSSTVPAEQPAAGAIGFRVSVPAGGSATLDYRVRARW